jgi:ribosomal protein L37AE/L43A
MPMNRVQFRGLSLPEFMDRYGTDVHCEQAFIAARWPTSFVCPACGVTQARTSFVREGRRYWQCSGCQQQCSVTGGTVLETTKLPLTRWFLAISLLTSSKNNVTLPELKHQIGASWRRLVEHKLGEDQVGAQGFGEEGSEGEDPRRCAVADDL